MTGEPASHHRMLLRTPQRPRKRFNRFVTKSCVFSLTSLALESKKPGARLQRSRHQFLRALLLPQEQSKQAFSESTAKTRRKFSRRHTDTRCVFRTFAIFE